MLYVFKNTVSVTDTFSEASDTAWICTFGVCDSRKKEEIAKKGEMKAFKHDGFWQCMDTLRDYNHLNKLASSSEILPWEI